MLTWIKKHKETIYTFFVYLFVFLFAIYPYSDPDWGWHYKYGEYFITHGHLLKQEIFSWTMPHYQWYNLAWLFDTSIYFLYKYFSFYGPMIAGALLVLCSFFILFSLFKLEAWKKAVLAFFFLRLVEIATGFGFKEQSTTVLFFSLLLFLLVKGQKQLQFLFFIPILFLVWANMHGDFITGLGVVGIFLGSYLVIDFLQSKKINFKNLLTYIAILVISFAATLINPYGILIYSVVFGHVSSQNLTYVSEWLPLSSDCSQCHIYSVGLYVIILFSILFYRRRISDLPYILSGIIFIIPAILIKRLLPIFCLVTIPVFALFLEQLSWKIEKTRLYNYVAILLVCVLLSFNIFNRYISFSFYHYTDANYCYYSSACSVNAVAYFLQHPPKGNGLNSYNWGGYLIGKDVPVKLFIDGRMHVWEEDGFNVFMSYHKIVTDDYTEFTKYNFQWVFIDSDSDLAYKLGHTTDLGKWKLVYSDTIADYFVREK